VRTQGIVRCQLRRNAGSECRVKPTRHIDGRQFREFVCGVSLQFLALPVQIGAFGVGLGADGNILTCGHGHGARHEAGDACDQDAFRFGTGRGNPQDQTRRRNDPVIGP